MNKEDDNKRRVAASKKKTEVVSSGHSWFLGIGINTYADNHFSDLKNAVADVEAMAAVLQERYDITKVKLLLEEEATRENIIMELDGLEREVQAEDKLIIFYAGHGHVNRANKGFWIPHDAKHTHSSQYLRNSTIRDYMESIASKHTLLIADSCFSGSLFTRGKARSSAAIAKLEQKASRWALCSGRHDELVDDGRGGGHSPFTSSILNILRENTAPKLNVGKVIDQVMELTTAKVEDQTPEGNPLRGVGHKGGHYVFVLQQREEQRWQELKGLGTVDALLTYREEFPKGRYRKAAIQLISAREQADQASWAAVMKNESLGALLKYIDDFPDGQYIGLAYEKVGKRREHRMSSSRARIHPMKKAKGQDQQENTFRDPRDGQVYKTVEWNGQVWLAENLNFEVEDSWWYDNDPKNGKKYGRLYTWEAAKKACPRGWRVPTDEDWKALLNSFGDSKSAYKALMKGGSSGFNALLGGWRSSGGSFYHLGKYGYYWSSTAMGADSAWDYYFVGYDRELNRLYGTRSSGHSCRCLKD